MLDIYNEMQGNETAHAPRKRTYIIVIIGRRKKNV